MTALQGIDKETLKTMRADAQLALSRLLTGDNAQAQSYDGKSVTYTPADQGKLRAWIDELTRALGDGTASRGPIVPHF